MFGTLIRLVRLLLMALVMVGGLLWVAYGGWPTAWGGRMALYVAALLALGLVEALAQYARLRSHQRGLAELATERGYDFVASPPVDATAAYRNALLFRNDNVKARNLIQDKKSQLPWEAFDVEYTVTTRSEDSGTNTHTYRQTVIGIPHRLTSVVRFIVQPAAALERKVLHLFFGVGLDVRPTPRAAHASESELLQRFSRDYWVRLGHGETADRSPPLTGALVRWFAANPGTAIEVMADRVLVWRPNRLANREEFDQLRVSADELFHLLQVKDPAATEPVLQMAPRAAVTPGGLFLRFFLIGLTIVVAGTATAFLIFIPLVVTGWIERAPKVFVLVTPILSMTVGIAAGWLMAMKLSNSGQ